MPVKRKRKTIPKRPAARDPEPVAGQLPIPERSIFSTATSGLTLPCAPTPSDGNNVNPACNNRLKRIPPATDSANTAARNQKLCLMSSIFFSAEMAMVAAADVCIFIIVPIYRIKTLMPPSRIPVQNPAHINVLMAMRRS